MPLDTVIYEKKDNHQRLAGLENGRLAELEIDDIKTAAEGSIFLGRILHRMDLANGSVGYFINIGDTREAFINAREYGLDDLEASEGQNLIVQVSQEQRAEKGAKLCRSLQFVGEYAVYCPYRMTIEISGKIEDKARVEELKELVLDNTTGQEGWIVRTSAEHAADKDIVAEMEKLRADYDAVLAQAKKLSAPAVLLEKSNPLFEFIGRNKQSLRKVVVNVRSLSEELEKLAEGNFEVELSNSPFAEYGVEDDIIEALQPVVKLQGGGRIIIEETRACTAIDVDSGSDKGNGNINRLNMEAAEEILYQIKLRNLSGKIIIDFAGLSEYRFLKNTIELLEQGLKKDYIKATCFGLSRAGNVEIVRMRRRPSLRDVLTVECPSCQGQGRVER